jgi:hypothetical protein
MEVTRDCRCVNPELLGDPQRYRTVLVSWPFATVLAIQLYGAFLPSPPNFARMFRKVVGTAVGCHV